MWEAQVQRVALNKPSRQPVAQKHLPGLQVNSLGPIEKKPPVSRKAGDTWSREGESRLLAPVSIPYSFLTLTLARSHQETHPNLTVSLDPVWRHPSTVPWILDPAPVGLSTLPWLLLGPRRVTALADWPC